MSYPNTIVLTSSDAVPSYPIDKILNYYASLPSPSFAEGYCTSEYPTSPHVTITWDTDHWALLYNDGVDNYIWKRRNADPVGDYEAALTTTGTITVTEYISGTKEMAHFIYYGNYSGTNKCYRLNRLSDEKVWDRNAGALAGNTAVDGADFANGNVAITYTEGLCGYPVTLPAALPDGEYDIIFFDALYTAATAADRVDGWGFKWHHNNVYAPKEKLIDRVG